jgi:proline iminopeptidase
MPPSGRSSCRRRSGRQLDPAEPRPRSYLDGLWGFLLEELPGGRTRLVVSGYQTGRPRWLQAIWDFAVYPPVHWAMQSRQFTNIKRLAESDYAQSLGAGASPRQSIEPRGVAYFY